MAERPIIFSAPMVLALLAGRKTMTRRLAWRRVGSVPKNGPYRMRNIVHNGGIERVPEMWTPWMSASVGDHLWVRESLRVVSDGLEYAADDQQLTETEAEWSDRAADLWNRYAHDDGPDLHPTAIPSIFMPRWASRITLVVTAVKVERLQDIDERDAKAEGVEQAISGYLGDGRPVKSYRTGFVKVWRELHGDDAWANNPEVVAIGFAVMARDA